MEFTVDPRLEAGSLFVQDMDVCQMRLCNNTLFPWLILVPKIKGAVDLVDLEEGGAAAHSIGSKSSR